MYNQTSKKIKLEFSYPLIALLPFLPLDAFGKERDEASNDLYLSGHPNSQTHLPTSQTTFSTYAKFWGLERKAIM